VAGLIVTREFFHFIENLQKLKKATLSEKVAFFFIPATKCDAPVEMILTFYRQVKRCVAL
jgi:hypothetical protein